MLDRLIEFVLPSIIGIMVHRKESLTQKERRAQEAFMASLNVVPHKTKQPVVVAVIGLVGSGKTSVARVLAEEISATVIEGDAIRICLRKERERYEGARKIAENAVNEIIKKGGNVVLDSDHIDAKKRASLREKAKKAGAKLLFIRTFADYDIMAGRVISANYRNRPEDFFGGASTKWTGSEQSRGSVIKLREMWRRTPHHYRWEDKGGGRWVSKKLPFGIFAEIDTTNPESWKRETQKVAKRILAL